MWPLCMGLTIDRLMCNVHCLRSKARLGCLCGMVGYILNKEKKRDWNTACLTKHVRLHMSGDFWRRHWPNPLLGVHGQG